MKKSTYILIGTLAFMVLAAFFAPVIFFRNADALRTLDNTALAPRTLDSFSSLNISFEKFPIVNGRPRVVVTESDSATAPVMVISKALEANAHIANVGDALLINIDLHTDAPGDTDPESVSWDTAGEPIATITVPAGMLKRISSEAVTVCLDGFSSPLELDGTSDILIGKTSRIPRLVVAKHDMSIATAPGAAIDSLVFLSTPSLIELSE